MEYKVDFSSYDALIIFLINSPVVPPLLAEISIMNLVLIKEILLDPSLVFVENGSLQVAVSFVQNVVSILSSFDLNKMNEYSALELCLQLRNIISLAKNWSEIKRIIVVGPKLPLSYYPKTSRFVFINHLLVDLEELLKDTSNSIRPLYYFILRVEKELRIWYSDLVEISTNPPTFLKEAIETITRLAYDTEYALDSFLVGDIPSWRCIVWLYDILQQFLRIEQEREYEDEKKDLNAINDMLLGGEKHLNVITIIRPSRICNEGSVMDLYNSPSIINHFVYRAFCCLTFDYQNKRGTVLELLSQLIDLSDVIRFKNMEELTKLVYTCLEGQRFLVMIDDLWSTEDWVELRRCFPDSCNGSRIVLTTETRDLAFIAKSPSIVQPQSPLNDEILDSLLQNVNYHADILEVRMHIAKRCKRESMTWVVLLLQTIPKTVKNWEQVANTLGSCLFGLAGSQEKRILDLTCVFLPDHLRSCFFYLGLSCERKDVLVSNLILYWIAEGFVKTSASQTLENTAEDYVADLIGRNLIVSTKQKTLGGAKFCNVVNSVLVFLSSKVMEDNFLETQSSSSSSPTIYYQHRLHIWSNWDEFAMSNPSGPFVRSLFFCPDQYWRCDSYDVSFIYNNFKFLRILKLDKVVIGDSFKEIGVLVLLRYLAVRSSVNFITPSIDRLWNLETFICKRLGIEVINVPDSIWEMTKLRHIHITGSFNLEPQRLEKYSSILDNLQTFSTPSLAYGDDMEKILRRIPGIRKLKCRFLDSWNDATNCNQLPVLGFLNHLVSLNVSYIGEGKYSCDFIFPLNLKKLTLSKFRMPWSEISQLAMMLCNLEVLKLENNAFKGEKWEMEDHVVFPKLKLLKLRDKNVVEWIATHDHFPNLESLFLDGCAQLLEIPRAFAYINTLRKIEVNSIGWCKDSVRNSAKLIKEEHMKHLNNDELEIKFYPHK